MENKITCPKCNTVYSEVTVLAPPPTNLIEVDNSKLPSFPPIGKQNSTFCVPFALVYYQFSHEYGLLTGENKIFSPKFPEILLNYKGALNPYETILLMIDKGVPTLETYPMWSGYPSPEVFDEAIRYRLKTVEYIKKKDDADIPNVIELIKAELRKDHVLTFGTYYGGWRAIRIKQNPEHTEDDPYVGEKIVQWSTGSSNQHFLTIVGYNDALWGDINNNGKVEPQELGAFKCANSWGPYWSDDGYCWLMYDSFYKVSTLAGAPKDNRTTTMVTAMNKLIIEK